MTEHTKAQSVTSSKYTDEQTQELVQAYTAADTEESRDQVVAEYSDKFGKTVASVRAKLASESVYVPKARKTKSGEPIVSKSELVGKIAGLLGKPEDQFESLEKANKPVLKSIVDALMVTKEQK